MQRIKKIIDFYIFSNIHVALATFCLTKITLLEIGISENTTSWFVFFSTLLSYNVIRFLKIESLSNWFLVWFKNNILYLNTIILGSFFVLIYLSFELQLKSILLLIPFSLTTFFYTFPVKKYALRNIAGLKIFLIAITWAGITVLFPLVQNYIIPRVVDYITFLQRFLFVMAITIPFDIRDLNFDSKELKTLPQQIGVRKSKFVGILFLLLFLFLEFFKSDYASQSIILLLIIVFVSSVLILKSTINQSKYYSAFFVESIPVLWFVNYLLLVK